jgi:hypothetical protein
MLAGRGSAAEASDPAYPLMTKRVATMASRTHDLPRRKAVIAAEE